MPSERKTLRARGHSLDPVVWVGDAGLSESVIAEIELALNHHELIKVKVRVGDRAERARVIEEIKERTKAELVQSIGNIALLYRKRPDGSDTPGGR